VLLAGMAAFTLFSLLIGLNSSPALLIVLRGCRERRPRSSPRRRCPRCW
jgi:hypothetical protein